jgi:hypothetical protein
MMVQARGKMGFKSQMAQGTDHWRTEFGPNRRLRHVGVNGALLGCFFVIDPHYFVLTVVIDEALLLVCEQRLDGAFVCCLVEGQVSKSCVRGLKEEPLHCCRRVLLKRFEKVDVSGDWEFLQILEPVLIETA